MFRVAILDIITAELIVKKIVSSVVLPGEEGEFSILDFHQPLISCLKDGTIKIDGKPSIHIKKGIARTQGNELSILVER